MLKRTNLNFLMVIFISLSLISCSSDSSSSTEPSDNIPPTISFENLSDYDEVSGIFGVELKANDNNDILRIDLYIDDQFVDTKYDDEAYFSINCNDYSDDYHTLEAIAFDRSGNQASTSINIYTEYDFAPSNDGKIKVEISHYKELDPVDIYGYGDPYFVYEIRIDGVEYDTYVSNTWHDTHEINSTIGHTFNIPDNTREYQLVVYVYDEDEEGEDLLDYTHLDGNALIWTITTENSFVHDFTKTYNGEDDGSSSYDDDDCTITLSVSMID
ncbi:MAG: hypothetical protein CR982_05885 [Candidatus Cloacimonadota bacterium]|nr:MAG: hypothetical protein CR982_05885 [Candidatus Cloacimonadota bacterium]PIE78050.1 MAG: hypothetical protein CSA15_09445 [Candidatus Delongbacteria bacterium]